MTTRTRTIAGREMTLVAGRRYLASRPMATRCNKSYPVKITDITDGFDFHRLPTLTIDADYQGANAILAAFNNGETSFEGRVW